MSQTGRRTHTFPASSLGMIRRTFPQAPSTTVTRGKSTRIKKLGNQKQKVVESRAGVVLYGCRELMEQILSMCDWRFLMMFARLERYSRTIVQYLVRKTLTNLLASWFDDPVVFLQLLEATGGGVTGSVARKLMECNSRFLREASLTDREGRCHDLNLVFPTGTFAQAVDFVRQQGYGKIDFPSPDHHYSESINRFAQCQREAVGVTSVSSHCIFGNGRRSDPNVGKAHYHQRMQG